MQQHQESHIQSINSPPLGPFSHVHYPPQHYGQQQQQDIYSRDFRQSPPIQQIQGGVYGHQMENSSYKEDFPALGGKSGKGCNHND